jgi:hypothetical protein
MTELLLAALRVAVVLLGGFLAVQAGRAAHRHGDRRMAILGTGLLFLTVLPELTAALLSRVLALPATYGLLSTAVLVLIGLGCVDYALNHLN